MLATIALGAAQSPVGESYPGAHLSMANLLVLVGAADHTDADSC